jgi:hypothetical protein
MGFINDKNELFNEIAASKAVSDIFPKLNKSFDTFNSVKSKSGNMIPLLLDLLKELTGGELKKHFNELLKKSDKIENKIKDRIIKEILKKSNNNNFQLSQIQNPILKTSVKNIDVDGTLKVDPNTDLGKFYYGKAANTVPSLPGEPSVNVSVEPGGDFTKFLFDVKQQGSGNWKNIMRVDWEDGDQLKVGIDPQYLVNKSLENFLKDFLGSVKILDLSLLFSTILDVLFGAVSSLTDAGSEWLEDKIRLKKIVDKIIDKESLSDGKTPIIYDNNFFQFNKKEKDEIGFITKNISNGDNLVDLGCGTSANNIDISDFDTAFKLLNESKPSLIKEGLSKSTNEIIKKSTAGSSEENKKTIESNIISEIFENLTAIITSQTIKPFNVILQQIGESLLNTSGINPSSTVGAPGVNIDTVGIEKSGVEDYVQKFNNLNVCIVKDIYSIIVEFLFDIVKARIIDLIKIKIILIQQDQLKNYKQHVDKARELLKTVTNLLSFINNLK